MVDRYYFENPYSDYDPNKPFDINEVFIKDLIGKYVAEILLHTDPHKHKINSRSRGDLYVGLSGIAFMFLRISQSCMSNEFPALEKAKTYVDAAVEIVNISQSQKYVSLLSGNAGVNIVSIVVNKALGKPIAKDVKNLRKAISIFEDPEYLNDGQDEMFVGRCGYLLGMEWLKQEIQAEIISMPDMKKLGRVIVNSGRSYARDLEVPLMYQYHGREYLGAAHGVSSILFSLLNIPLENPDLVDIKTTIDAILNLQDSSGNFPSKFNKPENHLKTKIHWCHGVSGVVFLMAKAYKIFNEPKYLESCLKCGDLVWQKGLLKKGPGICHGIGSSGYVFLLLFRLTNDHKHLYRAMKFAEFLVDERFIAEAREPDRPHSLFEGSLKLIFNDLHKFSSSFQGYQEQFASYWIYYSQKRQNFH